MVLLPSSVAIAVATREGLKDEVGSTSRVRLDQSERISEEISAIFVGQICGQVSSVAVPFLASRLLMGTDDGPSDGRLDESRQGPMEIVAGPT